MINLNFQGTFYVGEHEVPDNDFIGFVFGFQETKLTVAVVVKIKLKYGSMYNNWN